jgi:hypothetical protein
MTRLPEPSSPGESYIGEGNKKKLTGNPPGPIAFAVVEWTGIGDASVLVRGIGQAISAVYSTSRTSCRTATP